MKTALHRHLGDAGKTVEGHHVAHREDLGVTWEAEIGEHGDPACSIDLGAGGLSQHSGQGGCLDTGRPNHRTRENPIVALGGGHIHAARIHTGHSGPHAQLNAHFLEGSGRLPGQLVSECRQRLLATIEKEHSHG